MIPEKVKAWPILLGGSSAKFTIHLPSEVNNSNAHEISEDKKTLTWKFLFRDHLEEPMVMKAKVSLPIPWWAWLAVGILIILIFKLIRKIRMKNP